MGTVQSKGAPPPSPPRYSNKTGDDNRECQEEESEDESVDENDSIVQMPKPNRNGHSSGGASSASCLSSQNLPVSESSTPDPLSQGLGELIHLPSLAGRRALLSQLAELEGRFSAGLPKTNRGFPSGCLERLRRRHRPISEIFAEARIAINSENSNQATPNDIHLVPRALKAPRKGETFSHKGFLGGQRYSMIVVPVGIGQTILILLSRLPKKDKRYGKNAFVKNVLFSNLLFQADFLERLQKKSSVNCEPVWKKGVIKIFKEDPRKNDDIYLKKLQDEVCLMNKAYDTTAAKAFYISKLDKSNSRTTSNKYYILQPDLGVDVYDFLGHIGWWKKKTRMSHFVCSYYSEHVLGKIIDAIVKCINSMYKNNVFVRDVKVENIVIKMQDQFSIRVSFIDFGYCLNVEDCSKLSLSPTTKLRLCGTLDFIPPELFAVMPLAFPSIRFPNNIFWKFKPMYAGGNALAGDGSYAYFNILTWEVGAALLDLIDRRSLETYRNNLLTCYMDIYYTKNKTYTYLQSIGGRLEDVSTYKRQLILTMMLQPNPKLRPLWHDFFIFYKAIESVIIPPQGSDEERTTASNQMTLIFIAYSGIHPLESHPVDLVETNKTLAINYLKTNQFPGNFSIFITHEEDHQPGNQKDTSEAQLPCAGSAQQQSS